MQRAVLCGAVIGAMLIIVLAELTLALQISGMV